MKQLSDVELMLKYQEGDAQAMNELLARYKNPIYHFAFRLVRTPSEAEDLTQEVFLRLHQCRQDYRPLAKFSTWIFSIAHNLLMSKLRRKKLFTFWPRSKDDPEELVEFASSDPSPQDAAVESDTAAILKKCIQGLPFLQREALVLREYENLDYEEISKILNKPIGTIKTLLFRARMNLKEKLLPLMDELKGGRHE